MQRSAIIHTDADVYALCADEALVLLRTGRDVTSVRLVHEDPYAGGCMGARPWSGRPEAMAPTWELSDGLVWSLRVRPPYKRLQYYFEVSAGEETLLLLEDGLYPPGRAFLPGRLPQYFRFPWMNPSDLTDIPQWPADTIWYQIFPDRFCRGDCAPKRMPLRAWEDRLGVTPRDFYGGDLRGVISRLPYLHELGVTGVYLTPVMLSDSNHKYNIFDYDAVDPDFGTDADMRELVSRAHGLGMRVMVDAVFNHSGVHFPPWQDVLRYGQASRYADWFFISDFSDLDAERGTEDGRYASFAFARYMPKINTGHPEAADYLIGCCRRWVERWDVDGVRFDVGNEVSHHFLKQARRQLKAVKPDLFLLGEIWHHALPWLRGDEYDSIMHYPFLMSLQNFWVDPDADSHDFMHAMNRVMTMYPQTVYPTLFTFLDTHDVMRARTRCGDEDVFYQQLLLLMTMPGSPSLYYGTEIAMEGGDDPDNRRTMPWDEIDAGLHDEKIRELRLLIALRKAHAPLRAMGMRFVHDAAHPRLIMIERRAQDGEGLLVLLNAGNTIVNLPEGSLYYGRKFFSNRLLPGGCAVCAL